MIETKDVFTVIRKGMMHAGEKKTVIQACKIAEVVPKLGNLEAVCKDIDQIIVLAFEIVTKEMTRIR